MLINVDNIHLRLYNLTIHLRKEERVMKNLFTNGRKCGKLKTEPGGSWFSYAGIAQSVEQLIRNQQASGSSPLTSSN